MKHLLLPATMALFAAAPALAQYPSDAALNLAIADATQSQVQAKVVATSDGGAYVSWYDSDPAGSPAFGYDVRLQRLDAGGRELWPHGGVLVADRGFSSTQDYDLDVGPADDALLVFRDDRFVGVQVTAAKVDPSGNLVWGPNGVQLTNTTAFVAAPAIAAATDGGVIVGWSEDNDVGLQRLSAAGVPTWGANIKLSPVGGSYALSDMHAGDNGSAILSFVSSSGGFGSPRELYAQKVSSLGMPLWGFGHVKVFEAGSLQFGAFPDFISDGSGGAVFSWYSSSPSLEVFAQHVSSAGVELFPHNGVAASTDATQNRVDPAVAYDAAEQEVFLLYEELNSTQSQSGLSAQKLDASGNRMWGATGQQLIPLSPTSVGDTALVALDDGALLFWSESPGFGQDQLFTEVLDDNAAVLSPRADFSSASAQKYRLSAAKSSLGHAHVVWQDDRAGHDDIFAQDALPGGSLGGVASAVQQNGSGINPLALTSSTPPAVGTSWQASVDKSSKPANFGSLLYIYGGASSGLFLAEGEVLVDPSSTLIVGLLANTGPLSDSYSVMIPADISFVGFTVTSQAVILDAASQLTNALELNLGL